MTEDARAYALKLLGQRSYTTHNLRRKLIQKEFPGSEVESVLERLTESGLIDDKRFALNFARTKLTGTGGGASRRRIRQTLARKGIPAAIADEAIEQTIVDEGVDMVVSLERIARRKLATLNGLESHVIRRRMYGFLARRGYDVDEIRKIVSTLTAAATQ